MNINEIQRGTPPSVRDGDLNSLHNYTLEKETTQKMETEELNSTSTSNTQSQKLPVVYYAQNSRGPYAVYVQSQDNNIGNLHPLKIGRLLFKREHKDIQEIKRLGRNRLQINFTTAQAANNFLEDKVLETEKLVAFIPKHRVTSIGVIRGVDTSISIEEIQKDINSSEKVYKIERFYRKMYVGEEVKYIPTQTVKITFEAQKLPWYITLYFVRYEVEKYRFPVLQCKNCQRYGHHEKQCRGQSRCVKCGENHTLTNCSSSKLRCCNCSLDHLANSEKCVMMKSQLNIKKKMTELNISFHEAREIDSKQERSYSAVTEKDFPQLPSVLPSQTQSTQHFPTPLTQSTPRKRTRVDLPTVPGQRNSKENPFQHFYKSQPGRLGIPTRSQRQTLLLDSPSKIHTVHNSQHTLQEDATAPVHPNTTNALSMTFIDSILNRLIKDVQRMDPTNTELSEKLVQDYKQKILLNLVQ